MFDFVSISDYTYPDVTIDLKICGIKKGAAGTLTNCFLISRLITFVQYYLGLSSMSMVLSC